MARDKMVSLEDEELSPAQRRLHQVALLTMAAAAINFMDQCQKDKVPTIDACLALTNALGGQLVQALKATHQTGLIKRGRVDRIVARMERAIRDAVLWN